MNIRKTPKLLSKILETFEIIYMNIEQHYFIAWVYSDSFFFNLVTHKSVKRYLYPLNLFYKRSRTSNIIYV